MPAQGGGYGGCCATVANPRPITNRGAMGVLHQPYSSRSARTAAPAARVLQQSRHCIRTTAKPAPLPIEGPRGCCNSRTLAAAHVRQLPQPVLHRTVGTTTTL